MSPSGKAIGGEDVEKGRVCPSCRVTISVLATKCRFCGEEVGKPKVDIRSLSADDLGGETISHQAPSGNVMDALEAFRAEENLAGPEEDGALGQESDTAGAPPSRLAQLGLPELDATSRMLSEPVSSPSSIIRSSTLTPQRERTTKERLLLGGGVAIGIVVVLFGGIKGFDAYRDYAEERDRPPVDTYVNQTPGMLERNEPPLTILAEAAEALRHANSDQNRKYAESALARVIEEFDHLLNPEKVTRRGSWDMDKLTEASALAKRASELYAVDRTNRMKREVDQEMAIYRMTLVSTAGTSARITILHPETSTKDYTKTDLIGDRFKIKQILSNSVKLEDTLRTDSGGRGRLVTYEIGVRRPH